jgi:hypothetical protein
MSLVRASFTHATFAALLRSESLRCVRVAVERRWLPPVPQSVMYYFPTLDHSFAFNEDHSEVIVPAGTLILEEELVPHLFREADGYFRSEIVLSPFALTGQETVVEVSLRDPDWTDQIITGTHAFPHEPFQLHGPAMPGLWRGGEAIPMISLPMLQVGNVSARP